VTTPTDDIPSLMNLGNEAYRRGDLDKAAECYRRCLAIKPDLPIARYNLGAVYLDQDRVDEAAVHLQYAITAGPDRAGAYNKLGIVCQRQHRFVEAIAHYRTAVRLRPQFPGARFNLGMALLQVGQYAEGFRESEWRWQTETFEPFKCPHPRWQGEHVPDKTILIHTEQGSGDAIQFIRFVPLAARRCRSILLVCIADLAPIFAPVPGVSSIMQAGTIPGSAFDMYLPLLSLPHALGTTLETVPNTVPYIAVPEASRKRFDELFASQGFADDGGLKVGFAWAGSPTQANDAKRSCTLGHFEPLLRTPAVAFFSLQKRRTDAEQTRLAELGVHDLAPHLNDFGDTAAAIDRLDLVISVDTSVVHLAGALGKPVWNLLFYNADWRWLLERADSSWYPTMRLIRQAGPGDWASVFAQATRELRELAAQSAIGNRQSAAPSRAQGANG
jgi:TPR repeat/Glycosyltransferase family 9 (heptosyltransferase)